MAHNGSMKDCTLLTFIRECDRQSDLWQVVTRFHDTFQQPRLLLLCAVWLSGQQRILSAGQARQLRQWAEEYAGLTLEEAASLLDEQLASWTFPLAQGDVDTCVLRLFPEIGFCEGQTRLLQELVTSASGVEPAADPVAGHRTTD